MTDEPAVDEPAPSSSPGQPKADVPDPDAPESGAGDGLGGHAAEAVGERIRAAAQRDEERAAELDPREAAGIEPLTPQAIEELGLVDIHVCPICEGYGGADPNVMLRALSTIVAQVAPFPQSTVFDRCPECEGWGSVLTGSRKGDSGIQPCPYCHGNGYTDKREAAPVPLASRGVASVPELVDPAQLPDPMRRSPASGGTPPAPGMVWDDVATSWVYAA